MSTLRVLVATVAIVTAGLAASATPITYQGRLTDSGIPVTGSHDFEFTLFDAQTGGSQVGVTAALISVAVTNALFTVVLDFGAGAFAGSANRWLEVSVRPAGSGSYVILSPRQRVTAAPRAMTAETASDAAALGGSPAALYLDLSAHTGVLPLPAGGTGGTDAPSARTALGAASTGANTFSGNQQVTGSVAATGSLSGASASVTGDVSAGTVTIGGDTPLPSAPRMIASAFLPGTLTAPVGTAAFFVPDQPIVATRATIQMKTPPGNCGTPAVVRLTDGTRGHDLYLSANSASYDSGAFAIGFSAGANVQIALRTGAASCLPVPANANVMIQYRMGVTGAGNTCAPSHTACSGICENLAVDSTNCGSCGAVCSSQNVTPRCTGGACTGACTAGFGDCNLDKRVDGCEINLTSNTAHCGACNSPCPSGNTCSNGVCTVACTPTTCAALGKNCGTVPDGCGGTLNCGSFCPAGQSCGGGGTPNVCG